MPGDTSSGSANEKMTVQSNGEVDIRITAAALAELERIYESSGLNRHSHVPALLKSWVAEVPPDFARIVESRAMSAGELFELQQKHGVPQVPTGPFQWIVGLYLSERLPPDDLYSIAGVRIYLTPGVISAVVGKKIDYNEKWIVSDQ